MTKTRSLTIIIATGFLVSILFSAMFSFAEERMTFTAYYPAPNAYYNKLNATELSVTNNVFVGNQLNIGSADTGSTADLNIISPDNSAALMLLGDNDPFAYATIALASPSSVTNSTDPNVWIMAHFAMSGNDHKLGYMYHGSGTGEDAFVVPLAMDTNGDVAFYGNVTIPVGRMSIGLNGITDHGLFLKRDFEDEDNAYGILARTTQRPTTIGDHNIAGLKTEAIAYLDSADNTGSIQGLYSQALLKSPGTLYKAYGANIEVGLDGTSASGTIDYAYGVRIAAIDTSFPVLNGSINHVTLLKLDPIALNVPWDQKYAIYQGAGGDKNYFAGHVEIGNVLSPSKDYKLDVRGGARIVSNSDQRNFIVLAETKSGTSEVIKYDHSPGRLYLGNKGGSGSDPEVTVTGELLVEERVIGLSHSINPVEEEKDCGLCAEHTTCPCNQDAECETYEIAIGGGCEFESDDTEVRNNRPDNHKWLCSQDGNSDDGTALITRAYAICLQE